MVKFIKITCILFLFCLIAGTTVLLYAIQKYGKSLPDYTKLMDYRPALTTRLYATDGKLLKEYADENRVYLPYDSMPKLLISAFISAEDKNFFEHGGVDFQSLSRAMLYNVYAYFAHKQMLGGSTITQQVVKNLLLTNERTITRKIKEAILSFRLTKSISKEKVLELYLNQIFFGNKAYGIAAAALNYFDKSVDDLAIEEVAMLAALPKAPSSISPYRNPKRALARRNWVIDRMAEDGHISRLEAEKAKLKPIVLKDYRTNKRVEAEFFAESVRKELADKYGEDHLMQDGYIVRTTLDPQLQKFAAKTLQEGLETYDRRHGYRGPLGSLDLRQRLQDGRVKDEATTAVIQELEAIPISALYKSSWQRAVVLQLREQDKQADILVLNDCTAEQQHLEGRNLTVEADANVKADPLTNGGYELEQLINDVAKEEELPTNACQPYSYGIISLESLQWARLYIDENTMGDPVEKLAQVLQVGDAILVIPDQTAMDIATKAQQAQIQELVALAKANGTDPVLPTSLDLPLIYQLQQIPEVNGGLVAMDPHTGRVLAMMGGYIDAISQFNRTTQAKRQPGSTAKTFAYLAALENGFTPADIMMDEEIELPQGDDKPPYRPRNMDRKFYGPTTLRVGLEKSRNVVTVRLAHEIGLRKVAEMVRRFKVNPRPKRIYSMVLGSLETTLMQMTRAYAIIVNGGYMIEPNLIDKIQNRDGKTIYVRDNMTCEECNLTKKHISDVNEVVVPELVENRKRIIDPATAYQITSMLEGVVKRGTGWRARAIGKVIGGKTGTSNDSFDSWFIGFSPDLVVGVYAGFDIPRGLGNNESGSSIGARIFTDFMIKALADSPSIMFRIPPEIRLVKIDLDTGRLPTPNTPPNKIIYEAFRLTDRIPGEEHNPNDDMTDATNNLLRSPPNPNSNQIDESAREHNLDYLLRKPVRHRKLRDKNTPGVVGTTKVQPEDNGFNFDIVAEPFESSSDMDAIEETVTVSTDDAHDSNMDVLQQQITQEISPATPSPFRSPAPSPFGRASVNP